MADTKDWTWVLDRACPDCGFDAGTLPRTAIGATIRVVVERFAVELEGPDDAVRRRPEPEVWSTLEYGCHLVDVVVIGAGRLQLLRTEVDPTFPNWDQDESAIARRYAEQDPAEVRIELQHAGSVLADAFDGVADDEWSRRGTRSNGSVFTVESFGRYLAHDLVHHVWDIDRASPLQPGVAR